MHEFWPILNCTATFADFCLCTILLRSHHSISTGLRSWFWKTSCHLNSFLFMPFIVDFLECLGSFSCCTSQLKSTRNCWEGCSKMNLRDQGPRCPSSQHPAEALLRSHKGVPKPSVGCYLSSKPLHWDVSKIPPMENVWKISRLDSHISLMSSGNLQDRIHSGTHKTPTFSH